MSTNLEDPAVATGLAKVNPHPNSQEGQHQRMCWTLFECAGPKNCHWTITLISYASKVMLKILHARLQHYANQELPDVQIGFRKGRGTRDQIANIYWIIEKAREFQKNFVSLTMQKPLTLWLMTNWKVLREIGIPDHLTCLLRNLYMGQEATVRTLYGTTDGFKIEKGVQQGCLLAPCLICMLSIS